MDSSSWPESSPSSRIKGIQAQEWSTEMLQLPETAYCVENQAFEMFNNTLSFMSNYCVNQSSQTPINNTISSSDCLDGRRSIATNNIVKRVKYKRGCYIRKRSWTFTKVTSLIDDGHVWRKYGQKEIINATYKRNYYRCTHKYDQGCQATKQVQQIKDEPQKYKITYSRHHTCKNFLSTPQMVFDSINLDDTSILLSFGSNRLIEKDQIASHFPSYTDKESKDILSSSGLSDNQSSLFEFSLPHNLIVPEQLEASSITSTSLDNEDVVSKGVYSPIFEMDHILETINNSENPFDLAHCELTNFNYSFKI